MYSMLRIAELCEKVCILIIVMLIAIGAMYLMKPVVLKLPPKDEGVASSMVLPQGEPAEVALQDSSDLGERDLFASSVIPKDINPPAPITAPVVALPGHLKVVGIIIADPPQVAIEDNRTHQTYFISPGSSQAGIEVKEVHQDHVVFNFQGHEIRWLK